MKPIECTVVRNESLARAARETGYDLTMFGDYPKAVQETLRYWSDRELWQVTLD